MENLKGQRALTVFLLLMPAILLLMLLLSFSSFSSKAIPVIEAGVLDLSGWDRDTTIRLTGQWDLYPNLIADKSKLSTEDSPAILLQIPLGLKNADVYGNPLPAYDAATYRLHVINTPTGQDLGIRIGQMTSAYRLYIDEQLVAANGQFSDNSLAPISAYSLKMVHVTPDKSGFDIILQTANQFSQRGLIQWPLEFGDYHRLYAVDHLISVIDLLMVGGLLAISALILIFSLIVPWKKELLILAALGIATLLQVILTRQIFIIDLFPQMPVAWLNKVHYMIGYAIWFLVPASLATIYPGVFPRWFLRFILLFPLGTLFYVGAVPTLMFKNINLDWPDLVFMLIGIGCLFFIIKAVLDHRPGANLILILFACAAALILFYAGTGDSSLVYNIVTGSGIFFGTFVVAECFVVSRNYIEARKLELSALKDRIRPHFVHNAMAAIISISRTDPDRSRNLLINFSLYLRSRFDFADAEFVSFEQELETVKAYVALEQARFRNRLQVLYQIAAENFPLPPLTLQPLVENAVVHGLRGGKSNVSVLIYTQYNKKMVRIGVRDDGPGIMAGESSDPGRKGIALENINRRLSNIYGSQLHFSDKSNDGFDVYMEIPYMEVPQHESHAG